jgi:hypothetical protein
VTCVCVVLGAVVGAWAGGCRAGAEEVAGAGAAAELLGAGAGEDVWVAGAADDPAFEGVAVDGLVCEVAGAECVGAGEVDAALPGSAWA